MLTSKAAYDIVKTNNPSMKALTCTEQEDSYVFSLVPNNLQKDDAFANSAVYTVNKETGEYRIRSMWEILGNHIVRTIDVSTFE